MLRAYFVSDIHLRSMQEPNAKALLEFLRGIAPARAPVEDAASEASTLDNGRAASHLFLVGDIFDLWIGSHRLFKDEYKPLLDAARDLVQLGVRVHVFEGNHDLYLTDCWQGELGASVHREPANFALGPWTVRVEHGDQINPDDRGYLALRAVLRARPIEWLATHLPDKAVNAIGERMSRVSRTYAPSARRSDPDRIRQIVRSHAVRAIGEGSFDLIVTGHVHVEDDWKFQAFDKPARSVNLGWWKDARRAFVIEGGEARFVDVDSDRWA